MIRSFVKKFLAIVVIVMCVSCTDAFHWTIVWKNGMDVPMKVSIEHPDKKANKDIVDVVIQPNESMLVAEYRGVLHKNPPLWLWWRECRPEPTTAHTLLNNLIYRDFQRVVIEYGDSVYDSDACGIKGFNHSSYEYTVDEETYRSYCTFTEKSFGKYDPSGFDDEENEWQTTDS